MSTVESLDWMTDPSIPKYGWYSDRKARKHGVRVFKTTTGKLVHTTYVSQENKLPVLYTMGDYLKEPHKFHFVGEVTKCVGIIRCGKYTAQKTLNDDYTPGPLATVLNRFPEYLNFKDTLRRMQKVAADVASTDVVAPDTAATDVVSTDTAATNA